MFSRKMVIFVECCDCLISYDLAVFLGHPFLEMRVIYTRLLAGTVTIFF